MLPLWCVALLISVLIDCLQGQVVFFSFFFFFPVFRGRGGSGAGPASAYLSVSFEMKAKRWSHAVLLTSARAAEPGAGDIAGSYIWALCWKPTPVCWLVALSLCLWVAALCSYMDISSPHTYISILSPAGVWSYLICMAQLTQALSSHYIPIS